MSEFVEFTGKTTEEALHRAIEHFGLPLGRLEVEVVSAGSSGLFGLLGTKKAKVRVRVLAGSGMEAEMAELAAVVSDSHRPRPAAPQPAPDPEPLTQHEPASAPALANAQATLAAVATPSPPVAVQPVEATVPEPEPAQAAPLVDRPASESTPLAPPLEKPEDVNKLEETEAGEKTEASLECEVGLEEDPAVLAHAQEVLTRLVTTLDTTAQVSAQSGLQGIELLVQGQKAGVLIGRRGQNLEALQYLVTRIVSHRCGRPVRILVDAGEYRRRRREALEELAQRMAQKVRQNGRAVAVGPLSAQERRVVHLALKGEPGLTTGSRGLGELKKVVISPMPRAGQ